MKQAVPWWFFFPDVTFHYLMWLLRIAAVPWGWCDFSRLMWLKYGASNMQVEAKELLCLRLFEIHVWFSSGIAFWHILTGTAMGQLQTAKQWDIPPKDRYCSICSAQFRYKMVQARLRFWLQGGYYSPGLCAVCASSRLSPGCDRFGKRQQKDICLHNLLARTNSPWFFHMEESSRLAFNEVWERRAIPLLSAISVFPCFWQLFLLQTQHPDLWIFYELSFEAAKACPKRVWGYPLVN